ncbi:MAG: universal stress protein [Bacteroidia bacterium]|nr:universal stress protein [Bacteroidia bacterium]
MASIKIRKILVPVDFSGTGEKVLKQSALMAKVAKAEIILLHVLDSPLGNKSGDYFGKSILPQEKYQKELITWLKGQMEDMKKQLLDSGVAKVEYVLEKGTPYKMILSVAKKIKADIIIMGTHGTGGVREFVVGSNTFRVVSEATCPVLSVQKRTTKGGFKEILLPFCDQPHSRESVDFALCLAQLYRATLNIVGISYESTASALKKLNIEAQQIEHAAKKAGVSTTKEIIKGNFVTKVIFEQAVKRKADLIAITSNLDRQSISEYIIGPVIHQVVNHSYIPVLSIHPVFNPNVESVSSWRFWG